jgi:hypothetical protein
MSLSSLSPQIKPDISKDWLLENLGGFLKEDMNHKGQKEGILTPIINTFFTFSPPQIPHTKYPVLTLIRTADSWKRDGTVITSTIHLDYYLDYRNIYKHLGFSYWFSYNMHQSLSHWTLGGGKTPGEFILYDMDARYYTDQVNYRESTQQNREPYLAVWTAIITLKV